MARHLTDEEALHNAEVLVQRLRTIRADALRELDEFTVYVEQVAKRVEDMKAGKKPESDPRTFSYHVFASRAMEKVDDLVNIHKGGTRGMHVRQFRDDVLVALTGEVLDEFNFLMSKRNKKA